MGKRLGIVVFGLALVASACSGGVKGAQIYRIQSDQPEPTGKKIQFSQWFPGAITAQAGDTLIFSNLSSEAPQPQFQWIPGFNGKRLPSGPLSASLNRATSKSP